MSKSHTNTRAAGDSGELKIIPGLGLADLASSGLPDALAGKVSAELELFGERMRHGLLAAAVAVGLEVFDELLQTEVTEIAGAKGRHNPDRQAVRHGSEAAKVPMGGRLVDVAKPRVRATDGTGEIEAWRRGRRWPTGTCSRNTPWCRCWPACLNPQLRLRARTGRRRHHRDVAARRHVGGVAPLRQGHRRPAGRVPVPAPRRPALGCHLHRRVRVR